MWWPLVSLGCGSAERRPEPAPADPEPTPPWIYSPDDVLPELDLPAVEAAAREAFVWFADADPGLLLEAWTEAEVLSDGTCPYYTPTTDPAAAWYWYDDCSTVDGTRFDGSLYGNIYDPFDDGASAYWDYGDLNGDARVVQADGQELHLSGSLYVWKSRALGYDLTYRYTRFIGEASWVGGARAESWLGDAPSFDLEYQSWEAGPAVTAFVGEGGVSGLPGTFGALVFDGAAYDAALCADEPTGELRLQDRTGEWYALAFDGGACDGCAEVWFRGTDLGMACPDLSPLLTWEGAP